MNKLNLKTNSTGCISDLKFRLKKRFFILLSILSVSLLTLAIAIISIDHSYCSNMRTSDTEISERNDSKGSPGVSDEMPTGTPPPASHVNTKDPSLENLAPVAPPKQYIEADPYFSDALFIGDSRTQGLMIYSGLTNATFYATKGMNIKDVFDKPTVVDGNSKKTIYDALGKHRFGKIYIMLGSNELGWVYPEVFLKKYGELVDRIKETQPGATIYAQSILPVSAEKSNRDGIYNNVNISAFNRSIEQLAIEKDIIYLDINSDIADEDGNLPENAATDGLHLTKEYCIKWEEYLRNNKNS